ncbi:MAG: TetR-like C-terminal domain-containing protein [Candidatus Spyradocola sp.]
MSEVTKYALAAALGGLLEKRRLDDVTVTELCAASGVGRQTFYYHFHDIYELVGWMFDQRTRRIIEESRRDRDWRSALLRLMHAALEDRSLMLNTVHSLSREQLERYVLRVVETALWEELRTAAAQEGVAERDARFVLRLLAHGVGGILMDWLDGGMAENAQAVCDRLCMLTEEDIRGLLLRFGRRS